MKNDDWLGYAGKRVIVSGCYSGIGHATARQLLALGAEVHGFDWKPCDLALASFTQTDLRDACSIIGTVAGLTGQFDALFNCAGIPPGGPPMDVMRVNYIGTKYLTEALLPVMRPGSAIVNVASNGGMGWPAHVPDLLQLIAAKDYAGGELWCEAHLPLVAEGYRFSKEAMTMWTMAHSVQTPMLVEIEKATPAEVIDQVAEPIGRRSSADEQAAVLLFLNSPRASYINGVVLPVDGGFMATIAYK
jgi:NAD(P)-dependent dehydrogenase (short-subunit alcohol dehydrogenase family)